MKKNIFLISILLLVKVADCSAYLPTEKNNTFWDNSSHNKTGFVKKFLIAYALHYLTQTHADATFFLYPKLESSQLYHGILVAHYALGTELTNISYTIFLDKNENRKLAHLAGFVAAFFTYKPLNIARPFRWILGIT